MSEFLGEADVLIRPDTSKFRATLLAELEAATKGIVVPITVVASQQGLTRAKEVARTTNTVTAAKQKQAVADQEGARAAVQFAEAQRLGAIATERLAAIEGAESLTVGKTAAAKARLRASVVAVTAARKAEVAALQVENAELIANARANLASAEAQVAEAKATAEAAVAHARGAAATAAHAAREHAMVSGARAAGASLTGLRGATLATSGAFLAGAVAVKLFEKSVHEASSEAEAAARAEAVFGDQAHELEKESHGLADTFGLSAREALVFEGRLGTLFKNAGIATDESARLSETLTKLAADLAAFANVPTEKTLSAISLALAGNTRGLKQFGIELSTARVNALALSETGKKNVKSLTDEERIRARVALVIQRLNVAQGAASRRAGDLAQSEKTAKAELENLGGTIGRAVLPKFTELVQEAGLVAKGLGLITGGAEDLATAIGGSRFGKAVGDLQKILEFGDPAKSPKTKFEELKGVFHTLFPADFNRPLTILDDDGKKVSVTFEQLHQRAEEQFKIKALADLGDNLKKVLRDTEKLIRAAGNVSFLSASRSLDRLQEKMNDIKIAGGGAGDVLANLEQQADAARKKISAANAAAAASVGGAGHATAIERRREAKSELVGILDDIKSIRQQQAQDAQQAADAIQKIVDDAKQKVQEAIDAANQSFQDLIAAIGRPFEIRQLRVEATTSLEDDVKFQQDLQVAIRKQIAIASKIVGDERLRTQTIHDLTVALVQSQIAEKQLNQQRKKNAQERKAARFNREAESIDLDIELAQTNKNVRAEIRAREARIRLDEARLKAVKGDTLAAKRLRNDIASQRAAIKDLKHQVDGRRKDLEALEFSFLQTQSGFAANLLSNLLPTSSLAGVVGGGSISTPTAASEAVPPADFARAAHQRPVSHDVTRGAQTAAGGPRGATSGQASVQITLLRGILAAVARLGAQRAHPEAVDHVIKQAASMDLIG